VVSTISISESNQTKPSTQSTPIPFQSLQKTKKNKKTIMEKMWRIQLIHDPNAETSSGIEGLTFRKTIIQAQAIAKQWYEHKILQNPGDKIKIEYVLFPKDCPEKAVVDSFAGFFIVRDKDGKYDMSSHLFKEEYEDEEYDCIEVATWRHKGKDYYLHFCDAEDKGEVDLIDIHSHNLCGTRKFDYATNKWIVSINA
jgi:hypothetical protein